MHADVATAEVSELRGLVHEGEVLVLTGAGISTDSGIPDYRGPDGQLRHRAPMTYDRFVGSREDRRRYWARSHLGWGVVAAARPNTGHEAITGLQRHGLVRGIATQNVDGLHEASGARDVIDLHGRLDRVVCLDCGTRRSRREIAMRLDAVNPGFAAERVSRDNGEMRPDGDVAITEEQVARFRLVDCRLCGGVLKPDVVFFSEHVPQDRFRRALGLLARSRMLLVLGSSLVVGSGFRFVTAARRKGIPIAIVNLGATRGDQHAHVKIDLPLQAVLPGLVAATERAGV